MRLRKLLTLTTCLLGLAAGQVPASAQQTTTVSVLGWASIIDYRKGAWAELVRSFEAQNPGIKIRDVGVPEPEALNQITTMVLARNAPDVAQVFGVWIPHLAEMGAIAALDKYVPADAVAQYPKISVEALTVDKKLVGLPFYPGPIMMFYNRDLLQRAGLDPDRPPATFPEFTDAIMKICKLPAEGGGKTYGIGLRTNRTPNSGQWAIPIVWGHGGRLLDDKGRITLTHPGTIAAFQWYKDIAQAGCTPEAAAHNDTRNLFAQGRAGFIFEGPWGAGIASKLSGGKLKVTPDGNVWAANMPAGPDGQVRMMANDNPFVVFEQSKNKEAAVKFIRFVVDNMKAAEAFYQGTEEIATSNMTILRDSPVFSKEPLTKVMLKAMNYANPMPINHPKWAAVTDIMAVVMQKVMQGGNPKSELESAQREIDRIAGQ